MNRHKTRLTLLDVERTGQSFFVTTLTPDGETRRDVYGFWENTDNRPYVRAGSHVNAARGHADFGNYDFYIRDSEGRTACVEMWTDQIKKFMDLFNTTRYVKGTATSVSQIDESITLEYVAQDGKPDAFTFTKSSVAYEWAVWVYKSRSWGADSASRYTMIPLTTDYVIDLHVPGDALATEIDALLGLSDNKAWVSEPEDESPKPEAAATSYTL